MGANANYLNAAEVTLLQDSQQHKDTLTLTCCLLSQVYWLSAIASGVGGIVGDILRALSSLGSHCLSRETQKLSKRATGWQE